MSANPLLEYFENNDRRLIHKWMHYFDIYHRHFARFRGRQPTLVEFGVSHGGSLQMWKDYFGEGARIFGIDVDPRCKEVEDEAISIIIGDQEDRDFLRTIPGRTGRIDVLVDDGGHTMSQQIATFEEMFPVVSDTGVYLVEDLHTSYWRTKDGVKFGGGLRRRSTFVEYSKRLIDHLNAWHVRDPRLPVSDFSRSADSMTYYDSVLVIEKARREKPSVRKTGHKSF